MSEKNNFRNRPLYQLLLRGLPDYCEERAGETRLRVAELAKDLDTSKQAIYKRFDTGRERDSISTTMAFAIIKLSENTIRRPAEFEPLKLEDFRDYLN